MENKDPVQEQDDKNLDDEFKRIERETQQKKETNQDNIKDVLP